VLETLVAKIHNAEVATAARSRDLVMNIPLLLYFLSLVKIIEQVSGQKINTIKNNGLFDASGRSVAGCNSGVGVVWQAVLQNAAVTHWRIRFARVCTRHRSFDAGFVGEDLSPISVNAFYPCHTFPSLR
jgi:hypothetical protein